ncbi:MAG: DUF262 domain-containing protein, partial [Chloroflexota bacterium]
MPEKTEEQDDLSAEQEDFYLPEEDDAPLRLPSTERRVITQPYDFSVRTIVEQIRDKSLDTQPPFQRGYVWDDNRASSLIESLLLNIPIPVCYFSEEETGRFTVVDGHQRLYSIWRYVSNDFPLRGLRTLTDFNGKFFRDLAEREQRQILGRSIRCIVILQDSHPELRFEVFERLNRGSMQATDQEIRNAVFRGDFNELIKSLAGSEKWLRVLNKKQLDKRMADEELILRFFAVHDNYLEYQAPLRSFLDQYAAKKSFVERQGQRRRINLSDEEKTRLTELFNHTMDKVLSVFNGHAFRAFIDGKWERQVSKALFDAVTLIFARIPQDQLAAKADEVEAALKAL